MQGFCELQGIQLCHAHCYCRFTKRFVKITNESLQLESEAQRHRCIPYGRSYT